MRISLHILILTAVLYPSVALSSPDTVIPKPKQMKLTGRELALSDAKVVLASDEKKLRIAADELNSRIAELGARPLPVLVGQDSIHGSCIVVLHAGSDAGRTLIARYRLPVSADKPGEQGYVITSRARGGHWQVFLAGSDAQGALYAAVTTRHLIDRKHEQLVVTEAEVVDWPNFKLRQIGVPFAIPLRGPWYELRAAAHKGDRAAMQRAAEEYFQTTRRYIDWLLRHKSNFMDPQPAAWAAPPESLNDFLRAAIRRVNQYALDRGIGTFYYESICIGRYPKDKDNPDFKDVLFYKGHRRYFCWSRLDYHRRKARAIAKVLRDCAYRGFFLHDVDGGGWKDPAMWSRRCARCRKMYGDDHVAANRATFGIYYEEIKRLVPDVKFVAVIYPYSPNYLNPDWLEEQIRNESGDIPGARKLAEEFAAKHRRFLKSMHQVLPPDIYICVRENTRANIDLMRSVYGTRPFQLYFEYAYWKGWRPLFIMSPRWTKTFYYPGINDIIYGNNSLYDYNPLTQMYGLECAWNTDGPGREYMRTKAQWMDPRQCVEPRKVAKQFVQRACRDFWGDEAGPALVPFFMGNLSLWFIQKPDEVARKCGLTNLASLMRQQREAAARAAHSLAALWEKVVQARRSGRKLMSDYAYPYFIDYYKLAVGARIVAGYKHRKMLAREAIIRGDMARAETLLAQMRSELDKDAAELARLRSTLRREPSFASAYRKRDPFGALFHLDVDDLRGDLKRFEAERNALFESFNIPRWFRRIAQRRVFYAAPTPLPITIDGRLDEPAWRQTMPIEHFLDYRVLRLAALETVCRVLYDEKHMYVGFECFDPQTGAISIPRRARDDHQVVDSVEVFVDPKRTRETFYHWIIDAGGNLFDAARRRAKEGRWKYSLDFNSRCRFAVRRARDRWFVEMAIPFAELGAKPRPGQTWGFNVCRNIVHSRPEGEHESVAAGFLGGANFHAVQRFPALVFAPKPSPPRRPDVVLRIRNAVFRHVTTGEGGGAEIAFDAILETTSTLHDVSITGEAYVGERRAGAFNVMDRPRVELMWRSVRPVTFSANDVVSGLEVVFTVRAREGEWRRQYVFGRPPRRKAKPAQFVPGVDGRGRALASIAYLPAFHDSNGVRRLHIKPDAGTIEFWVRPNWDGAGSRSPLLWMRHTFVDMGPVRYDYPYLTNMRSIAILDNDHGGLTFVITNRSYKSRATSASIRHWRANEWHHVACQWRIRDGKCQMTIFLDGKKASGKVGGSKVERFVKEEELLPIQVGAMNTGAAPADAAIDELRISDAPRWRNEFVPPKRPELDEHTTILFRFDGDLKGLCPDGTVVEAKPGSAG